MAQNRNLYEYQRNSNYLNLYQTFRSVKPLKFTSLFLFIILSVMVSGTFAQSPSVAFKVGAQTIENPIDLATSTETRFEVEIGTQRYYDKHFDMAFSVGGSPLGTFRDYDDGYYDDDVYWEDYFVSDLTMLDIRLGARFYPLDADSKIQPYVGAGLGYFWFFGSWTDTYSETIRATRLLRRRSW